MTYWTTREAAQAWGVSERRVQKLLSEGRVSGAVRQGRRWAIPAGAERPSDQRSYRNLDIAPQFRERFAAIDALKAELTRRRPLSSDELERIRREFTVEYTYDSNAIEGSTLTLRETALILDGLTIGEKPLKEHLEAIGHRDAYEFVETLAARVPPEPITSRIIRDIHFLVLADRPDSRGDFRHVPVRILGTAHRPPEPIRVPELIDELLEGLASSRHHPIEKAAQFHLRFESIHPFIDGNGPTGRLLHNLKLLQSSYLPINIKYTDRRRYYDCFLAWDETHDPQPMIELVNDYVEQRLREWVNLGSLAIVNKPVSSPAAA
ncbi:MAG: Fic family protein [Propionibacteriaceae bacterium]|jgi:Fic family protein|nr:Fic family protein [Propionibacteriaceae bacterium]